MNGNQQPQMPQQQIPPKEAAPMLPGPKSAVWLWIILVAVAVAAAGVVLYFILLPEEAASPTTVETRAFETPAQDLNRIEQELQGVNLEGLDTELDQIEQELQRL